MLSSSVNIKYFSSTKTILLTTLVAGTLDILAAILVYDSIMQVVTAK